MVSNAIFCYATYRCNLLGRNLRIITYYFEKEPLGNAGALFQVKDQLTDDFLLLNADAMFDIDFNRFVQYHKTHDAVATLFTHPNSHPYDSGVIIADEHMAVRKWLAKEDERPEYFKNRVNAGLHVLNKRILEQTVEGGEKNRSGSPVVKATGRNWTNVLL